MRARAFVASAALMIAGSAARAQERGAAALSELVEGLGTTTRVLMIGAHPDDEDTNLIAWLARGRHVETAYLSLTRGDGGQNLIGNELGEALGVIRTEELLAARRIDGGKQFFARAYDFGFSKTAEETYRHWPHDSLLQDVVTVVRSFRPHVIIAVFSGTPRDGHGHHQVSGLLAREAYDAAGDAARFPASATGGNPAWTPLKFYRAARFNPDAGTLRMNVGEYDPVLGRSFAEIAGESRSQHRSQGFGALQRKGTLWDWVRLEGSRVNEPRDPRSEQGLFDGIDTTLHRLRAQLPGGRAALLDSLALALAEAQGIGLGGAAMREPEALVAPLARVQRHATRLVSARLAVRLAAAADCPAGAIDLCATAQTIAARAAAALLLASGIDVEATAPRPLYATGVDVPVTSTVYNRGRRPVTVLGARTGPTSTDNGCCTATGLLPDSATRLASAARLGEVTQPWWLARPRTGDVFPVSRVATGSPQPGVGRSESASGSPVGAALSIAIGRDTIDLPVEPVVFRYADPARGEIRRPVSAAPTVSVLLEPVVAYARANTALDRVLRVELRAADSSAREVRVSLQLPNGLMADTPSRSVVLAGEAPRTVEFRVRGRLAAGVHRIAAVAESGGARYATGYVTVDYEHIRPQRLYRPAVLQLTAVDIALPFGVRIAYVPGVSDNVAPMLEQLGVPVTVLDPHALAGADLSDYTTLVVGPRAYQTNGALLAANAKLFDWVRKGGTMVVQYGQEEMARPGYMPFPVTYTRPADRVTEEDAAVVVTDPSSPLLAGPNRIAAGDFAGWVQERALYMPRTWDPRYRTVLGMHDENEPPRESAILSTTLGQGRYVYTTLSFFRQLPAGNPGAARLFVNLLAPATPAAP